MSKMMCYNHTFKCCCYVAFVNFEKGTNISIVSRHLVYTVMVNICTCFTTNILVCIKWVSPLVLIGQVEILFSYAYNLQRMVGRVSGMTINTGVTVLTSLLDTGHGMYPGPPVFHQEHKHITTCIIMITLVKECLTHYHKHVSQLPPHTAISRLYQVAWS